MKDLRAKVAMFNKLLDLLLEASKRLYFQEQCLLFIENKVSELGYVSEVLLARYNTICYEIEDEVKKYSWEELEATDMWSDLSYFKEREIKEKERSQYE